MGGFLIVERSGQCSAEELRKRYRKALDVFRLRELPLLHEWLVDGAYVVVFGKRDGAVPEVVEESPTSFSFTVGTPLMTRKGEITGAFAKITSRDGHLTLVTDPVGSYPVFRSENGVVTSSFLAARCALGEVNIDPQGFYEYVLGGATYGEDTYLTEVKRLSASAIHTKRADGAWVSQPSSVGACLGKAPRSENQLLELCCDELKEYFELIAGRFGDSIAMGLTGGFDSRLMFAVLMSMGIRPRLYVRGARHSPDVQIASTIAAEEGIALFLTNRRTVTVEDDALCSHVGSKMLSSDGFTDDGCFRLKTPEGSHRPDYVHFPDAKILLNGGGGEIFRDYWELPARAFGIKTLIRHGFRWKTQQRRKLATGRLDTREFYERLGTKLATAIQAKGTQLSREEVSLAYPYFRVRHWTSAFLLGHHPYRHALLPYADAGLVSLACSVPVSFRFDGAFQAKLIAHFSQRIASYPSNYGHNFNAPVPLKRKATGWLRRGSVFLPDSVVVASRNTLLARAAHRRKETLPLVPINKLEAAFGSASLRVSEFFDVAQATESAVVSRVLTVEAVLRADRMLEAAGSVSGRLS